MPLRNVEATLSEQLQALARQTYSRPWQILAVDDASTDTTVELLESWTTRLPELQIIRLPANRGTTIARNAGVVHAAGQLILFCDGDDVVDQGWIEAMVGAALHCDLIAGALGRTKLNRPDLYQWQPPPREPRAPDKDDFLPFAVGANLGIWRDVLDELGGWDETVALGAEDVALSWEAQLNGYVLHSAEEAIVHYRHRRSLVGFGRQQFRNNFAWAQLYSRYRDRGMKRDEFRVVAKTWASLIYRLPQALLSRTWRITWVKRAAPRVGRLVGSIRYRVLYL
jgi:glycosyltransferase involved in cell wall biosynthesis